MKNLKNQKQNFKKKSEKNLPQILKYYNSKDYSTQQKALFFYNIYIAAIIGLILLIFSSSYVQLNSNVNNYEIYLPTILIEINAIIFTTICVLILLKGYYRLSAHIFYLLALLSVWLVMWIGHGNVIERLNTVVIMLALLNMTTFFLKNHKSVIIYIVINIAMVVSFTVLSKNQLGLSNSSASDYITDTSIAILFTGVLIIYILKINKGALEKVELDYKARKIAEKENSELKYKTLFENAQIGIYQTTPDGQILNANPAILQMLGYNSLNEIKNKNLEKGELHGNYERQKFKQLIEKEGSVRNFESKWKKKNGDIITIIENAHVVKDANGKILYYDGFVENITERKKAEKDLKESEEKYRTLMDNMNEVIIVADINHIVQYVNKKFTEKLGYSSEEIVGKVGYKILHNPSNYEMIEEANQKRINKNKSQYEIPFIAKDGHKIDFLVNGAPITDSEGKIIASIGAMVDITDRKNAEQALKESVKKFRDMADMLPVAVWETDLAGICTYTNKMGYDLHKYTYEDFLSKINVLSLITPEDKERASENLKKNLLGESILGEEYTGQRKDGTKFPVRVYTSVIYENKVPIGFRGVTVDISKVKEAEMELKESEERYRTIIEAFPDIIMISDLNGNIIFGNPTLERVTGITVDDYNNPKRKAHIHPDDQLYISKSIIELLKGKKNHTSILENRFIDKWGNLHWFSGIISKLTLNNKIYLQTITREVTDKKIIEQELEKHRNQLEFLVQERTEELAATNEELVSTNEELHNQREELEAVLTNLQNAQKQLIQAEKMASLGVLAAGVAHEINNPLNFIKGGVVGLENYFDDNLKEYKVDVAPLLEGINVGVERAAAIVTSLNHYSRRDDLSGIKCDIHLIIDNCLVMLQNYMKHKIEIIKNYTSKSHILLCNEGKLHQVILNILTNAVQAINDKGSITINTNVVKDKIEIAFKDTGCGINEDVISKILDPFFTTKEPGKGTGLGLSITYNILQEYNGTIEFESKPNKGTTVIIKLPLNQNE